MEEQIKQIRDYPHYYVSNFGYVYSMKTGDKIKIGSQHHSGKIIVHLCRNGKAKAFSLNHLVADYFLDNANEYKFLEHIDGDLTNCRVDNLVWRDGSNPIKRPRGRKPKVVSTPKPKKTIDDFMNITYK
jgi:hypothetical protein